MRTLLFLFTVFAGFQLPAQISVTVTQASDGNIRAEISGGIPGEEYWLESSQDLLLWNRLSEPFLVDDGGKATASISNLLPAQVFRVAGNHSSVVTIRSEDDPPFGIAVSGEYRVIARFTLQAFGEPVTIPYFPLVVSSGSPGKDLVNLELWDGNRKFGSAIFNEYSGRATIVPSPTAAPFVLEPGTPRTLVLKATFKDNIGNRWGGIPGDVLVINFDGESKWAYGLASGTKVPIRGTTAVNPVWVHRGKPVMRAVTPESARYASGTHTVLCMEMGAVGGDIGFQSFLVRFEVDGNLPSLRSVRLHAYQDEACTIPANDTAAGGVMYAPVANPTFVNGKALVRLGMSWSLWEPYIRVTPRQKLYFCVKTEIVSAGHATLRTSVGPDTAESHDLRPPIFFSWEMPERAEVIWTSFPDLPEDYTATTLGWHWSTGFGTGMEGAVQVSSILPDPRADQ